jgi:hypothetical protein
MYVCYLTVHMMCHSRAVEVLTYLKHSGSSMLKIVLPEA